MAIKFEQGKRYTAQYTGGLELTSTWEVIKRSAKRVTLFNPDSKELVTKAIVFDEKGNDMCFFEGTYSPPLRIKAVNLITPQVEIKTT